MPLIGPEAHLVVFAKAPVPGMAKTRLAPVLGVDGAADLHRRLVLHTLKTVRAASGNVHLYCAPDAAHPFFAACAAQPGITLHAQCGGDLGARMREACERHLRTGRAVIIVGTDSPALNVERLVAAAAALADGIPAVLCPAEDGGYALLGLARRAPELFADMPWGTDAVMAATRTRLQQLGWRWTELPAVWDVDRPEDCERLLKEGWLDVLPR